MTVPLLLAGRRSSPLGFGDGAPRVLESDTIRLRGLRPGAVVNVGGVEVQSSVDGDVDLTPRSDERFTGHVGLLEIRVDSQLVGELEIVPDKMSEDRYRELRSELQRLWTDLAFDPESVASLEAGPPPARELWRRLEPHVASIVERPHEELRVGQGQRRFEQVRRSRELTPSMVRARQRGGSALVRVLERRTDTAENQMAGATLALLRNHARRSDTALAERLDRLLLDPLFAGANGPVRRVTWGMRSDRRYRELLAVHRLLRRPELAATEGPGELRLGVKALPRLYEYWVFLRVLRAAIDRYGMPDPRDLTALATPTGAGRHRLELRAGTTVQFPGDVFVAFEPSIQANGRGWLGLEYVPHPDPDRAQLLATPDVVVFRATSRPWLTVMDAKYIGRSWVETAAARTHEKYSRMRWHGQPVVRDVLILHPHDELASRWAGYGHLPAPPGSFPSLPLPAPAPTTTEAVAPPPTTKPTPPTERRRTGDEVCVVADQFWMHRTLRGRRIDLRALSDAAAPAGATRSVMVLPRLAQLVGFAAAAENRGWDVEWTETVDRHDQITALRALIGDAQTRGTVVLVSDEPALVQNLEAPDSVFIDLGRLPDL